MQRTSIDSDARVAFLRDLLTVVDLEELGAKIERHAKCHFGVEGVHIVTSANTDECGDTVDSLRHSLDPGDGPGAHVDKDSKPGQGDAPTLGWPSGQIPPETDEWREFIVDAQHAAQRVIEVCRLTSAFARTERAKHVQRALFAIASLASSDLDMPEVLRGIHAIIAGLMYAENFYIALHREDTDTLRFLYFVDSEDTRYVDPEVEIPVTSIPNSLTLGMMRSGKSQMGPSHVVGAALGVQRDESLGPEAEDWLGVPMIAANGIRGAIVVQSYGIETRYSEDDRDLLTYVAQHVLTALERKQAQEELEDRVEQRTRELASANAGLQLEIAERERGARVQAALFEIAERSSTASSIDEFYATVHAIVSELLSARNFYIALISDDGESLDFPYSVDEINPKRPSRQLGNGITEFVLRTGRALLVDRAGIEAMVAAGDMQSIGPPARSWLGVPLLCDERTVGVLAVQSYDDATDFDSSDQELLTFVAHHIGSSLERKLSQQSLHNAYTELEARVESRTRELGRANHDLTRQIAERERIESRLMHQALHDALTGLPNRALLLERLDMALARYAEDPTQGFAVLFLDLDRFKIINDSVGHLVGDEMLKQVARRLAKACAPELVARLGGDEFAVLVEGGADIDRVTEIADRLIDALIEPIRVAEKEMFTSTSVGIAIAEPHYTRAEELLRDADAAMYRAKSKGRHRFEVFDEHLRTEAMRALDLESDLRRAITRTEFEPHFQSIVELASGKIVGYEALLRWHHPERGLLAPDAFLATAEENGSIEQIDWQMFAMACRAASKLPPATYVSINVSARRLRMVGFDQLALGAIESSGLSANRVRLEITEGALLDNPEHIRRVLLRLRYAGVLVQLDDFGTGYSSLSYLHRFPIHALKIDRSFVAELSARGSSAAVVRAIVALAESLGIEVIAEGVETAQQCRVLMGLGCTIGQGFLFSRPEPIAQLR